MQRSIRALTGEFLWEWYLAFEKSRIRNQEIVRNTLAAVSSISNAADKDADGDNEIQAFTGGWAPRRGESRSLWLWIKTVVGECRQLSRFIKEKPTRLEWVIADDRRTGVIGNHQALSALTRRAGNQSNGSLLGNSDTAYVAFTPNLLALPSEPHLGIHHLCYLSLFVMPFIRPLRFLREVANILSSAPREAWRTRNFLKCCALAASFMTIDASIHPRSLTLLTSNSFVVEMMRYAFLRAHPDRQVNEILHGIPSIELDDYHKSMGALIGPTFDQRMNFISPFQAVQPFSFSTAKDKGKAINLRINKLLGSPVLKQCLSDSLKLKRDAGAAMIVAINGAGNVINEHYTSSTQFQIELGILKRIEETGEKHGIDIVCLYSIHPAHYPSGEALKIADALGSTRLANDSLTTWLAADICISIFSGAAWEAAEFGSKSLIGVRPSDFVFDPCVYSGVCFPTEGESFFDCIDRTILETQGGPLSTPEDRFMHVFGQEVLTSLQGTRPAS